MGISPDNISGPALRASSLQLKMRGKDVSRVFIAPRPFLLPGSEEPLILTTIS